MENQVPMNLNLNRHTFGNISVFMLQVCDVTLHALALPVTHQAQWADVMAIAAVYCIGFEVVMDANFGGDQAEGVCRAVCIGYVLFQRKV
jgi:hypothetical protein